MHSRVNITSDLNANFLYTYFNYSILSLYFTRFAYGKQFQTVMLNNFINMSKTNNHGIIEHDNGGIGNQVLAWDMHKNKAEVSLWNIYEITIDQLFIRIRECNPLIFTLPYICFSRVADTLFFWTVPSCRSACFCQEYIYFSVSAVLLCLSWLWFSVVFKLIMHVYLYCLVRQDCDFLLCSNL